MNETKDAVSAIPYNGPGFLIFKDEKRGFSAESEGFEEKLPLIRLSLGDNDIRATAGIPK